MFSILNRCVDFDYLLMGSASVVNSVGYDDIDSITEYFIEKIVGDDKFISEDDDDSGQPENKTFEKDYAGVPLYWSFLNSTPRIKTGISISSWPTGLDISNRTCKGYFNITSPPPDVLVS